MGRYLAGRVIAALPVLLGVTVVVFLSLHAIPGDPAVLLAGDDATADTVEALRVRYGLDRPLWSQYIQYLWRAGQGDLGDSWRTGQPVWAEILDRYPNTLVLALTAIALTVACGVTVGVISAHRRGALTDSAAMVLALVGVSAPSFWIGLLLQWVFAVRLGWLPTAGLEGWRYVILPSVTLAAFSIGNVARMTRAAMVDVLGQDYVRTARAKGATSGAVLIRHALRTALIPVVTIVGLQLGFMLGGAVITETVFAYPGIGRLLIQGIAGRDYAVVQGVTLIVATTYVIVNIATDLVYAVLDPRIVYA
jgi:ABC-type dipeptide/oligopeptide/nickel transport system permease component